MRTAEHLRKRRTRLRRVLGLVGAQVGMDDSPSRSRWNGTNRSHAGSATAAQRFRQLPRPPRPQPAAAKDRVLLRRRARRPPDHHLSRAARRVCRFANGLRELGVRRGDRVAIYMPMIPELPVAMLACARIGAAHSVIFGGFSPESIVDRVNDAQCVALITADYGWRRGQRSRSSATATSRWSRRRPSRIASWRGASATTSSCTKAATIWWDEVIAGQPAECEPEPMNAEDLLFFSTRAERRRSRRASSIRRADI